MTARDDFSLEELLLIRTSIGAELDIIEDELDDPRNEENLNVSRGAMLNRQITLVRILNKVHKRIREHNITSRILKRITSSTHV